MKAALYWGECQVCARQHKLPGGRLAKHGYQVTWNHFRGTCRGAGHLPFEQDCAMVKESRTSAQVERGLLLQRAADSRVPATEPRATVSHYGRRKWSGGQSVRMWIPVELRPLMSKDGRFLYGVEYDVDGEPHRRHFGGDTLLDIATQLNQEFAQHLDGVAVQLERYIQQQERRLKDWAPRPLQPIVKVTT